MSNVRHFSEGNTPETPVKVKRRGGMGRELEGTKEW
jgi:hypothetical protein